MPYVVYFALSELTSKKKRPVAEPNNKQKKGTLSKSQTFTALKPSKMGNSQVSLEIDTSHIKTEPTDKDSESFDFSPDQSKPDDGKDENNITSVRKDSPKKNMTKRYAHKQLQNVKDKNRNYLKSKSKARKADSGKQKPDSDSDSLNEETERRIEENEQFIIDLLSRTQPHHDHCYTTMFGKKPGIETLHVRMHIQLGLEHDGDNSLIDVDNNNFRYGIPPSPSRKHGTVRPIKYLDNRLPTCGGEILIVCAEEIVNNGVKSDSETESDENSVRYNYSKLILAQGIIY